MTDIDDIINKARNAGGSWVKLDSETVGDHIKGEVLHIEERDRTDPEGNVVVGRKSGQPRKIYRLTFRVDQSESQGDDDDLIRKFDANESAQYAINEALRAWRKDHPQAEFVGCRFALSVKEAAPDKYSQAQYAAKFGGPTAPKPAAVPIDELIPDEPPF